MSTETDKPMRSGLRGVAGLSEAGGVVCGESMDETGGAFVPVTGRVHLKFTLWLLKTL